MRLRRESIPTVNLVVTGVTLGIALIVAVLVGTTVLDAQMAVIHECGPGCEAGGPVFPAPWVDPWFYLTPLAALVLVVGTAWLMPLVADLRTLGE